MKKFALFRIIGMRLFILSACRPTRETPSIITQTTESLSPAFTITLDATQELVHFQFAEHGPYWMGNRVYTFMDNDRNGRKIEVQIYYPAIKKANEQGGTITRNAAPDMRGAPYSLILTGTNSGNLLFKAHLASYGFVMAIVRYPEWYDFLDYGIIHPRDMLFALDQIASTPLDGLYSVIDTDHVGVAGYSWEGFYSLALAGVRIIRINPDYYLSYCEQATTFRPELDARYLLYTCDLAKKMR